MADRSSYRHSSASDSDSQHTFHIAQNAPSILPKPPAPAVLRNSSGELNEKQDNGFDHDLEKQANMSPRRTLDMTERYNPYSNRIPYDQSSISSDESDHLVEQLESKAIKILVRTHTFAYLVPFFPYLHDVSVVPLWSLCLGFLPSLCLVFGYYLLHRPDISSTTLLRFSSTSVQRASIPSRSLKPCPTTSNLLLQHHSGKERPKSTTGPRSIALHSYGCVSQRLGRCHLLGICRHDR